MWTDHDLIDSLAIIELCNQECSPSCGKIHDVLSWYQAEYEFAQQNILLHSHDEQACVIVDNQLLREDRDEGLLLRLDRLIDAHENGQRTPVKLLSTAKAFSPSSSLVDNLGESAFTATTPQPIGSHLSADKFYFRRNIPQIEEGAHHLEHNLIRYMPQIITAHSPMLTAAQITTQIEFDLTSRTILKAQGYRGKKVLFIAGLNIDISPQAEQLFPLTKFVPWAAFIQERDDSHSILEQRELMDALEQQSTDNPNQIDLEAAIQTMSEAEAEEIKIDL